MLTLQRKFAFWMDCQHKNKSREAVLTFDLGKPLFQRNAVATEAERNAELVRALPKCSSIDEVSCMLAIFPLLPKSEKNRTSVLLFWFPVLDGLTPPARHAEAYEGKG